MRSMGVQRRVFLFVVVAALLIQFPPDVAGTSDVEPALAESSGLTSMPPAAAAAGHDDRRPVEITFTKWVTTFPLMEGVIEGDVVADFVGEILQRQVSVNPNLNGIIRLEAIYEVQAADRTFTALIRGGTNAVTGAAILDGVVLAGWRTGAPVHVEFDTLPGCPQATAGAPCFHGTIRIGRAPRD
jgi:hypothetical protein